VRITRRRAGNRFGARCPHLVCSTSPGTGALKMTRGCWCLILMSLAALTSADPGVQVVSAGHHAGARSDRPGAVPPSSHTVSPSQLSARAWSFRAPPKRQHQKPGPRCIDCSGAFYRYRSSTNRTTPEPSVVRSEADGYEDRTRPRFGPIIRRDGCFPKVYVRSPESGDFKSYCGSSEVLASESFSVR